MPCDACLTDLPFEFLMTCPVTGGTVCLACASKGDVEDTAEADRLKREDAIFDRLYSEVAR